MKHRQVVGISLLIALVFYQCGQKIEVGKSAPDITVYDLNDQPIRLSDFRGKLIILHFWADWCSECRSEFPRLQKAWERWIQNNPQAVYFCVNAGQSKAHVEDFKEEFGITFPMYVDEYAHSAKLYQVKGLPTTFVINPQGKIVDIHVGWITEKYIIDALNRYLPQQQGGAS